VNIIPFRPEHLAQINLQERQRRTISHMTPEWLLVLAQGGPAVSAVVDDRIIGSAGIVVQSEHVGFLWGAISQDAGAYFLQLHRAAVRLLDVPQLQRIEAVTEVDFPAGRRWLELLGFECEGRIPGDGPNGDDHYRYAWAPSRGLLN
jgi:RimJ/RimL family protein N-acetyltransferase